MKISSITDGLGDSFLLQDDDKTILFDAGRNYENIKDYVPKKIDIAICSHNDSDHSNGFVGLLNDWSKEIIEIWLPGYWQPILYFIKDVFTKYQTINFSDDKEYASYIKEFINNNENIIDDITLLEDTDEQIENLDLNFLEEFDLEYYASFFPEICLHYYQHYPLLYSKIRFKIDNIVKIAKLAIEHDCKITWFLPSNEMSKRNTKIQNLFPVNSTRISTIKKVKNNCLISFLKLLQLSVENKYSLVFEYNKKHTSLVLFTADNDLFFIDNLYPLIYKNQIVITVPHHGAESCKSAYNKIFAPKIVWLRSSGPKNKDAKQTIINEMKKNGNIGYCDFCSDYNEGFMRIELKYINNSWECLKGRKCICK